MRNKLCVFILCIIIAPHISVAQYSFTISTYTTGNCNAYGVDVGSAWRTLSSRIPDGGYIGPFNSKGECESTRQVFLSIPDIYNTNTYAYSNCRIHISATPCTGSGGGVSGSINITGPDQGTSFYTPSSLDEILNWDKDTEQKKMALNSDYEAFYMPKQVSTGDDGYDEKRKDVREDESLWKSSTPYIGDGVFKGIPNTPLIEASSFGKANMEKVNSYLERSKGLGFAYIENPQDLSLMLQQQFLAMTGYEYDVNEIINKINRTDDEKQALADYNEYAKLMCDQMASEIDQQMAKIDNSYEKKQLDFAILAHDSYGAGYPDKLAMTDYSRISSAELGNNPYLKSVAEAIEICNETNPETGFHAVLYYNEKTGSYVIGCEGSTSSPLPDVSLKDLKDRYMLSYEIENETGDYVLSALGFEFRYTQDQINDWGLNNVMQSVGVTAAQFELAHTIADAINRIPENIRNELDLSIVGHSLGGGLASVIGLATGKTTYTYNAEGVSENYLKEWGLSEKNKRGDYDITAIHTAWNVDMQNNQVSVGDLLTTSQSIPNVHKSFLLGGAVGVAKEILNPGTYGAKAIGKEEKIVLDNGGEGFVNFAGWHPQEAIVEHQNKRFANTQAEWERIRYSKNSILAAKQENSISKTDHLNILLIE